MNRKEYKYNSGKFHQARYAKVLEQMDLLGIMDITTTRQDKNGTIVWKLPIKNQWKNGKLIEVASFATGYVRNQGKSCHSNYQLNKRCQNNPEYYPEYKWVYDEDGRADHQVKTGKYRKYVGKRRILIPIEIDRLEYLIAFCLKNYYITYANHVANGDFVTKWGHEWELKQVTTKLAEERNMLNDKLEQEHTRVTENNYLEPLKELSVNVNGQRYKVI